MAQLGSNKIVPILGVGAVLFLGFIGFRMSGPEKAPSVRAGDALTEVPRASTSPDGDTPADTIRTLQAQVATTNNKYKSLETDLDDVRTENEALKRQNRELRSDMRDEFDRKLAEQRAVTTRESTADVNRLEGQVERLEGLLEGVRQNIPIGGSEGDPNAQNPLTGLPAGFGLEGAMEGDYLWLDPMDAQKDADGKLLPVSFDHIQAQARSAAPDASSLPLPEQPTAFFTINNLATLAESTAFTAIIGRVPIAGQISDPVPFRVLVGKENLAASGLNVPPEIIAMVFGGDAIGDWTLGCTTGRLHTATFIFQDGTIRTVSTRTNVNGVGFGNEPGAGGGNAQERLGYITDRYGVPCISGKRVSNARSYLAGQIALSAAGAAAEAAAAAESSQIIGAGTGTVIDVIDGNTGRYVAGRAISGGFSAAEDYLAQRLNDSFDVVFVEPGREVAILIDKEIAIDYDPQGRKLDYAQINNGPSRHRLD